MLGQKLPIEVTCGDQNYMFDYTNGAYRINGEPLKADAPAILPIFAKDESAIHLKRWFTLDRLPEPEECLYVQCTVKSLLFPKRAVCLLVGYAEKYRKYFYPLQIDLDKMTCYLTGQPIYYNFNQAVALDIHAEPPVLRIHSFSRANVDNAVYQPRSKRDLDLFWEPPVNLIRTFSLNPSPAVYQSLT